MNSNRLTRPSAREWLTANYFRILFFIYIGVLLALFTFLVPPFQKPDETGHFFRATAMARFELTCSKNEDGQYYFNLPRKYAMLPAMLHTQEVAFRYYSKFNTDWLKLDFSDPKWDQPVPLVGESYDFCALAHAGELPAALGILATRPLDDPLISLYSGRVAGALLFIICLVASLMIIPDRYKLVIYLYCGLPMVLHQVTAVSYDVVELSLIPLLFSLLVKFLTSETSIKPAEALLGLVVLWFVVNAKAGYFAFGLLYFLIPYHKIGADRRAYGIWTLAIGLTGVVTTMGLATWYAVQNTPPDPSYQASSGLLDFVLRHPVQFLQVCFQSGRTYGPSLVQQTIGVFGWLDYSLESKLWYYAFILLASLILYIVAMDNVAMRRLMSLRQIVGLWAIIVALVLSIFIGAWVFGATGAHLVMGVQGRYFLPLLPFAALALSEVVAAVGRSGVVGALDHSDRMVAAGRSAIVRALASLFVIGILVEVYLAISHRYYG